MKIGFIGLDIMGKPMAKNLMKAGHQLVVSTRNAAAAVEFACLGADTAASPRDIAEQVELVITMLPNSPQVKEVALGPGGIVEAARPGLVFIDMSSIAPLASREIHGAPAEKGVAMLDAPVSGGEPKAIDGTLLVMVGGDKGSSTRSSACWMPSPPPWSMLAQSAPATRQSSPTRSSSP